MWRNSVYTNIKTDIEKSLSKHRFEHSINVEKVAVELALIYGCNSEKASLAAIAHDLAKQYSDLELLKMAEDNKIAMDEIQQNSPQLLHGPIATYICKYSYNISDEDVLNAIYYHTTGRSNMSLLEKIIYLADVIEEGRDFPGIDSIRQLSKTALDKAIILSCNSTINYVIEKNELIHPFTIELRNSLLLRSGA